MFTGQWVDQQFELVDLGGEWVSREVRLYRTLNAKADAHIPLCEKQEVTKGFHICRCPALPSGQPHFHCPRPIASPIYYTFLKIQPIKHTTFK